MSELNELYTCWRAQLSSLNSETRATVEKDQADVLVHYRRLAASVLSLSERVQGRKPISTQPSQEILRRNEYIATFLQSMGTADDLLFSASYLQIAVVLKQQIECLAALEQIAGRTFKEKRVPNVANALSRNITRVHKNLQPAAHLSQISIVSAMSYSSHEANSRLTRFSKYRSEASREALEYCMVVMGHAYVIFDQTFSVCFGLE